MSGRPEGYHFELCLSPVRTDDEMAGRKFTGGQRGKNSIHGRTCQCVKKSSIQNETPVNKDSAIYHDTSKLLESYRECGVESGIGRSAGPP